MSSSGPTLHAKRRMAPAAADVQLKELGLRFFSTLIKTVDYSNAAVLAAPLDSVANVLCAMKPMHLFPDWSPPREDPEKEVPLKPSAAFASSPPKGDEKGPAKAVEKDGTWVSTSGQSQTHWGIKLDDEMRISSVYIEWDKAPEKFEIQLKRGTEWETVEKVSGARVESDRRFPLDAAKTQHVRLLMKDYASGNKDRVHSIKVFRVNQPDKSGVHVGTKRSLDDLQDWMSSAVTKAPDAVVGSALRGLVGLTLASGSLSSLLRMSQLLLTRAPSTVGGAAGGEAARFVAQLEAAAQAERVTQSKAEDAAGGGGSGAGGWGVIEGVTFDPSGISSSVSLENGNMTVRSQSTSYAALTYGPVTKGKVAWECKLDEDTTSQCSCFGALIKPVTNNNYEYSPEMWMYRSYNGRHYQQGSTHGEATRRIYKGDIVRCELDMDVGHLRIIINGEDQGVCFDNMAGKEVWPAVSFYSSSRVITLLKFEGPRSGGGGGSSGPPTTNLVDLPERGVKGLEKALGKGSDLGWDSKKIKVDGKDVNSGLGMWPVKNEVPDDPETKEGEEAKVPEAPAATVTYDLKKQYARFRAKVALNDDVDQEKLRSEGSPVTFSVLGDGGAELWSSAPINTVKEVVEVDISLLEVDTITLKVQVESSNVQAHAVWVDPVLEGVTDWSSNGWVNDRDTFTCALTGAKRGEVSTLPPVSLEPPTGTHGLAQAALVYGGLLANEYMRGMRVAHEPEDGVSATDLESAFAVEASGESFRLLTELLAATAFHTEGGPVFESAAIGLIRIAKANLRRLIVSRVNPAVTGLGSESSGGDEEAKSGAGGESDSKATDESEAVARSLAPLHEVLKKVIESKTVPASVRGEAVDAEDAGMELFVPNKETRKALVASQLSPGGVVEVQLSWPVSASTADGDEAHFERVALLLQLFFRSKGWKHTVLGRWPAKLYIVAEVPDPLLGAFLEDDLATIFNTHLTDKDRSGDKDKLWSFPDGLAQPELPCKVERVPGWDRRGRLPLEPGVGAVRVYPDGSGTYDQVLEGLRAFLPKRHLTS